MLIETGKAFGISLILFFLDILITVITKTFTKNIALIYLIESIITICVIFFIYKDTLCKKIKDIKKDFKLKVFLLGILGIILTIIIDRIFILLLGTDSINNKEVIEIIKSSPVIMSIATIIIIPLKEELIYRLPYKNTNKLIGLILSSIIFALVHITSLSEIIYLIPYLVMSLSIGLNFFKTDNIYISYMLHALNNLINVLLLIW